MKSDRPHLLRIADAIDAIKAYVAGGRDTFMRDRLIPDDLIRNFEIIGEGANRLSPALREATDVHWAQVIAFRNRLIHGYWSIDLPLVWDVIGARVAAIEVRSDTAARSTSTPAIAPQTPSSLGCPTPPPLALARRNT